MSNEEVVQTPEQVAVENDARAMGWVPQGEYRDGDHYVDAETFVKRGKEINPILRKNNEALLKKLNEAQNEIAEVRKVAKEFEQFQKDNAAQKVKALQQELDELKEKKKDAVSSGNGDAVVAIDDAIDIVKDQQREARKPVVESEQVKPAVVLDPVFIEWMEQNKWFSYDEKYTKMADAIGFDLSKKNPGLKGKDFFEKLDEELLSILPDGYRKTPRRNPVEGASGNRPSGSKRDKSYTSLPQDAKDACDRMVKQKLLTKEAYVATYYEND